MKIFVAGGSGMVGGSIIRSLKNNALYSKHISQVVAPGRSTLDLEKSQEVRDFFESERPDHVYIAAAKVGSIEANNKYPVDFISKNQKIQLNIIESSFEFQVKKLLFLGASCIYPKYASQPLEESALLTGSLEPTNEAYAIAKIAGITLCNSYNRQFGTDYRCVIPSSLYGPGDNYKIGEAHVIPALIRRIHEAKHKDLASITIWGSGKPLREFLYVDDLGDACVFLMSLDKDLFGAKAHQAEGVVNIGSGQEITIFELTKMIAGTIGFEGEILLDRDKPDGTPRKLVDSSRIRSLGWMPKVKIQEGLKLAYEGFLGSLPRS